MIVMKRIETHSMKFGAKIALSLRAGICFAIITSSGSVFAQPEGCNRAAEQDMQEAVNWSGDHSSNTASIFWNIDPDPYRFDYFRSLTPQPILSLDDSPRPTASRFAVSALGALSDSVSRNELAAFTAQESIITGGASNARLSLAMFDADNPSMAILAFSPDYAESLAFTAPADRNRESHMALRYESVFDSYGGNGLNIGFAPHAGIALGQTGAAAEAGLTARFGQYLRTSQSDPSWWFFAGADQQAVMYDPGEGFDVREAFAMQPYAIVGDAQAGLAVRLGPTDLSLAYIHRETRYEMARRSWDAQEGFAAFSLTWKH
jgi:hypothetical protein